MLSKLRSSYDFALMLVVILCCCSILSFSGNSKKYLTLNEETISSRAASDCNGNGTASVSRLVYGYLQDHDHLREYRDFAETIAHVDKFVLHTITYFDSSCYKKYIDLNIEILDRVWTANINSNHVQNNWTMGNCGKTLASCDTMRWNHLLAQYENNEKKNDTDKDMNLYTHLDPDFFLLYDFSTLRWMSSCIQHGFALRQMSSNFHVPWISMSHACFSHRLIREIGPNVIRRYINEYADKQVALYALISVELFDGNFHHMLQHSMESVYSEMLGTKLEKPATCSALPAEINTLSSVHLPSCKGMPTSDVDCILGRIRNIENAHIQNWNLADDIKSDALKSFDRHGKTPIG